MKIIDQDFIVDLEDPIGSGQYGEVYFCQQKDNTEQLAAKVFKNYDDQTIQEIENLQKASKISDYVVKYITHFFKDGKCILVTEYCEQTLESYLKQLGGRMPEKLAQKYFIELLKALKDIDSIGLMHRDIKVENLFITNNQLKLGDFGFSTNDKYSQKIIGTPLYMDPNMIKADLDGKTYLYNKTVDVWASGIVLFQMVFGYYPFKIQYTKDFNQNLKRLVDKIKSVDTQTFLDSQDIKISSDLKQLLMNMLVVKQKSRWTYKVIQNSTWIQKGAMRYNQEKENEAILVSGNMSNVSITMSNLGFKSIIKKNKQINKKLIKAYFQLRNYFNDQNFLVKFCQLPIAKIFEILLKFNQLLQQRVIQIDTFKFQLCIYKMLFLLRVLLIEIFQRNLNYIQEHKEIGQIFNLDQKVVHEILSDLCQQEFQQYEQTYIDGEEIYLMEKENLLQRLQNKNNGIKKEIQHVDKLIQLMVNNKERQQIIKTEFKKCLNELNQEIYKKEYADFINELYYVIYALNILSIKTEVNWTSEYEKLQNYSEFDIKIQAKKMLKNKNIKNKKSLIKDNIWYILIIVFLIVATLYSIFN